MDDFHLLPQLRDSLSYLYIEHAIVDRKLNAIEYMQADGRIMVPVAALCVLMLGPGTSITHAAMKVLAENGVTVLWVGEDCVRYYAQGFGETHKARHILKQAEMLFNPETHEQVVKNMYYFRFEKITEVYSLPQLRGMEGSRVRQLYADMSRKYGVEWSGRDYKNGPWQSADPVNRALSAANALLNGICHAAIVSGGYSPALGFIHTGRQLSFVYDIADLYKSDITIPAAFEVAAESPGNVERRVRISVRERIREEHLLDHILRDIDSLLGVGSPSEENQGEDPVSELWERLFE